LVYHNNSLNSIILLPFCKEAGKRDAKQGSGMQESREEGSGRSLYKEERTADKGKMDADNKYGNDD